KVKHVLELADWTMDDFTSIKDIGPVVSENTMEWFSKARHIKMLKEMEALGVNLKQTSFDRPKELVTDGVFSGKTILFTDTLATMGRKEAQDMAEAAGAKNISAVSGNLDILVVGEDAGSKLEKATKLGTVQILSEEEFIKLMNAQ
ncbi:MAG TPA: BRCT domain-containing protein, partial [Saprospiraceae bacterium]|nr:BRCT domain-containing protein [Saprospiraceae bacterium]